MAIADVNAVFQRVAPTKTGQIIVIGPGDAQNIVYKGLATVILGTGTTFTLNFIDGTETLPFTPSGVILFRCGGTEATDVVPLRVSAIDSAKCTVTISGAGTGSATLILAVILLK